MRNDDFPKKLFVRLEPDNGRELPDIEAVRTAKEHATARGEVIAEYVLNKVIRAKLVTTETLIVDDYVFAEAPHD